MCVNASQLFVIIRYIPCWRHGCRRF